MTYLSAFFIGSCLLALAAPAIHAQDNSPALSSPAASPPPAIENFSAEQGKYQFAVDTAQAPDLSAWAKTELRPVIENWYPRIVILLASPGYQAPRRATVIFKSDLGGTPAYTSGDRISCNIEWFKHNLRGEAHGAVVHEMVHVVQHYGQAKTGFSPPPGWIVEGIADYIRWFLYEPQSHGADIHKSDAAQARYDASYRTTANFLDWVCRTHDEQLVNKLNAACREGVYQESLWKTWTGKTVQELGEEWKTSFR